MLYLKPIQLFFNPFSAQIYRFKSDSFLRHETEINKFLFFSDEIVFNNMELLSDLRRNYREAFS